MVPFKELDIRCQFCYPLRGLPTRAVPYHKGGSRANAICLLVNRIVLFLQWLGSLLAHGMINSVMFLSWHDIQYNNQWKRMLVLSLPVSMRSATNWIENYCSVETWLRTLYREHQVDGALLFWLFMCNMSEGICRATFGNEKWRALFIFTFFSFSQGAWSFLSL